MNARQKNLVMVLLSALVAGGLGLYTYFGVVQPEEKETQRKEVEQKLLATPAPGERGPDGGSARSPIFTWVSVEVSHSKTVMERKDGTWRITSPVSSLADRPQVDSLIHQLATAKFKATIEENPTDADLERYGLKTPRATVSARAYVPDAQGGGANDPARQHSVTVHMGIENTFDGSVYLRREGDPRVYSAQGELRLALMKDTNGWRDKVVFPIDESSLLRIEVKARKNSFTLERTTTDKPWKLTQPMELRADPEQVAQMISALKPHLALLFPDAQQEEKARPALEKPLVEATFVPKLGEPVRVRLTEVELNGMKQAFALSEWGSETVLAQVDSAALNVLDVAPLQFKDKKVLAVHATDVQQIVIHPAAGGETIKLAKAPDTGRWEVEVPMAALAKEFKVASLLGSLEKLKGAAITESRPKNWGKYGISETSRSVSLLDGSGQVLARLWIGSEVKGNTQRLWARGSSEDVLEVDKSALDALPLSLEEFVQDAPAAASSP